MSDTFLLISCQLKSIVFRLKNILFLFCFIFVSLSAFLFFIAQNKMLFPKVLICNEDESMEARLLLDTVLNDKIKTVVDIETVGLKEGKDAVYSNKATAMLHIKPETISGLLDGETIAFDIYVNNKDNDFNQSLIDYFISLADSINVAQNTGLMYMDTLYSHGYDYAMRMEKVKDMQFDYIKTTLSRDEIFNSNENSALFNFIDVNMYYYSFLIFIIFILDYLIKHHNLTSVKKIRERLELSGYSKIKIELSENIITVVLTVLIGIIADNLSFVLGTRQSLWIAAKNSCYILALAIIIRSLAVLLDICIKNKKVESFVTAIVYTALFFGSGTVFPSYIFGNFFVKMNMYNPITHIHHILIVNRVM